MTAIPIIQRLVAILVSLILLLVTIQLIRKRKLREEYALLWLLATIAILVLSIFGGIVSALARFFKHCLFAYSTFGSGHTFRAGSPALVKCGFIKSGESESRSGSRNGPDGISSARVGGEHEQRRQGSSRIRMGDRQRYCERF